jgi:hypothetical protein
MIPSPKNPSLAFVAGIPEAWGRIEGSDVESAWTIEGRILLAEFPESKFVADPGRLPSSDVDERAALRAGDFFRAVAGDDDLIVSGVGVVFFGFFFSGSCSVSDSTFSPLIARSMCRIAFVRS